MRMNLVLDDELLRKAFHCSPFETMEELCRAALKEFVANHSRRDLRELKGKIHLRKGYAYKALRR